jgi:hypothetical protein
MVKEIVKSLVIRLGVRFRGLEFGLVIEFE